MDEGLKPCPFCGASALEESRTTDLQIWFRVACSMGCCNTAWYASLTEAIRKWNLRTDEDSLVTATIANICDDLKAILDGKPLRDDLRPQTLLDLYERIADRIKTDHSYALGWDNCRDSLITVLNALADGKPVERRGIHALDEVLARLGNLLEARKPDNPENDCTDWAHPAWWRGEQHAVKVLSQSILRILGYEHEQGEPNELFHRATDAVRKIRDTDLLLEQCEARLKAQRPITESKQHVVRRCARLPITAGTDQGDACKEREMIDEIIADGGALALMPRKPHRCNTCVHYDEGCGLCTVDVTGKIPEWLIEAATEASRKVMHCDGGACACWEACQ